MKKGLTFVAASALAISAVAVAPVSADAAANTAAAGFYDTKDGKYFTVTEFQKMTTAAKAALLTKDGVYLHTGTHVVDGKTAVGATNSQLASALVPKASFTAADLDKIFADSQPGDFKVESVSAINKTKIEVKFNKEVDAVSSKNFTIEGAAVTAATLSEDKKTVVLSISGLDYSKTYKVVVNGVLVDGEQVKDAFKSFTMPAVTDLYTLKVEPKDATLTANGGDNTVVSFQLLDVNGQIDKNADDIVLEISTTFGNLANSRVTVQNGVGQVVLASEFSTKEVIAKLKSQVIEASGDYKDLIGKIAGESEVRFLPSGAEFDIDAITFSKAESNQADRVVLTFDKAVAPQTFVLTNKDGSFKTDGVAQIFKDKVNFTVTQDGKSRKIVGVRSVGENAKAIEVILAKEDALKDNAEVTVEATLGTTNNKDTFILTDARQPEVTSVNPEGLKTLKLKFSESISDGTFKIDGIWSEDKEFAVKFGEFDPKTGIDYRDTAEITLLKYAVGTEGYDAEKNAGKQRYFAAGSHSLTVTNLKDFAGETDKANVSTSQGLTFEIKADENAPKAEVAVESPEQIRVTFDKEVEYTADLEKLFADAFEIYDTKQAKFVPVQVGNVFKKKPAFTVKQYSNEFVVELTDDWTNLLADSKDAYYNYKFQFNLEAGAFTNASNGVESANIVLNLNQVGSPLNNADNNSPQISDILPTLHQETYKVVMTEPVKLTNAAGKGLDENDTVATTQTNGLPTVQVEFQGKDKDGKNVVIPGTVDAYADLDGADSSFYVSTNGETLQGLVNSGYSSSWKVVVKSISDDIGNTAATLTKDFVVEPEVALNVFEIIAKQNGYASHEVVAYDLTGEDSKDRIEVTFTKGVVNTGGINDLTSPANWTLNGSKLTNVATIEVADVNGDTKDGYEKVIITFNDDKALKATSNTIAVNKSIVSKDGTKLTGVYEVVATTILGDAQKTPLEIALEKLNTATAAVPADTAITAENAEEAQTAVDAAKAAIKAAKEAGATDEQVKDAQTKVDAAEAKIAELDASKGDNAVKLTELPEAAVKVQKTPLGQTQVVLTIAELPEQYASATALTLNYDGKTFELKKSASGKTFQHSFDEKYDVEDVKANATVTK